MEHYSAEMWLQFIEGSIEEAQASAMEDHLVHCEDCLKLYAFLAESSLNQQVSPGFTQKVMEQVASLKRVPASKNSRNEIPRKPKSAGSARKALGNYAVAACLTLLLTAAGIFGGLASALPGVLGSEISLVDTAAKKVDLGWSEKIAEKTLSILDIIKPD